MTAAELSEYAAAQVEAAQQANRRILTRAVEKLEDDASPAWQVQEGSRLAQALQNLPPWSDVEPSSADYLPFGREGAISLAGGYDTFSGLGRRISAVRSEAMRTTGKSATGLDVTKQKDAGTLDVAKAAAGGFAEGAREGASNLAEGFKTWTPWLVAGVVGLAVVLLVVRFA